MFCKLEKNWSSHDAFTNRIFANRNENTFRLYNCKNKTKPLHTWSKRIKISISRLTVNNNNFVHLIIGLHSTTIESCRNKFYLEGTHRFRTNAVLLLSVKCALTYMYRRHSHYCENTLIDPVSLFFHLQKHVISISPSHSLYQVWTL